MDVSGRNWIARPWIFYGTFLLFLCCVLVIGFVFVGRRARPGPLIFEYPLQEAPESTPNNVVFHLPALPPRPRFDHRTFPDKTVKIEPVFDREFTHEKFRGSGFDD